MVPSWMFDCAPMMIGAMSPRTTALYQTLDSSPRVTSPMTAAVEAMKAVGWMLLSRASLLLLGRRKQHLSPGLDRSSVLDAWVPCHGPDKVAYRALEGWIVGGTQAHDVHRAAFGGHLDPEKR